jgi:TRAP-type mannitol/chloroaromatic compound transport system substrate-binding protein
MNKLGVSTSLLPGGEIFPALEKGAIDAAEFSQPIIDKRLGFWKIVKYNYYPGWHQQATMFELLINKKTWGSLHKSQKAAIRTTCKASMTQSFSEGEYMQFEVMKENITKRGVKQRYWSPEMLAAFKKAWEEVVEDLKKDAGFNKVWTDLSKFRKGYDLWESHAFLPRAKR